MTTGVRTVGSALETFYYKKSWSGADGKYDVNGNINVHNYWARAELLSQSLGYTRTGTLKRIGPAVYSEILVSWTAADTFALQSRLSNSIKGHSFNLAVASAELGQTVGLIVNTVRRFSKAMSHIRRGRIGDAVRALGSTPQPQHSGRRATRPKPLTTKDVSSHWLEIQYGWTPLLSDVYESANAYSVIADKPRRSSGKVAFTKKRKAVIKGLMYDLDVKHEIRTEIQYTLTELLSIPRSLGLQNPVSVVWEKVPFSFVVDWFYPIGAYLDNMSVIPHVTGRFATITEDRRVGKGTGNSPYTTDFWGYNFGGLSANGFFYDYTRTYSTSIPVQKPSFRGLEALSSARLKNATALLHQIFT